MPENIVGGVGHPEKAGVPDWMRKILERKEPIIKAESFEEAMTLFAEEMGSRYFDWGTVVELGMAALKHSKPDVA